jgi:toxin ParE1/3/4
VELIWSDASIADRMSIFAYIADNNETAARKIDTLIFDRANGLLRLPHLGRPGVTEGTRELTIHPNYRLVYEVRSDAIEILNVVHASRNWPRE